MGRPVRIHASIRVEATRDDVWRALLDIDRQPVWMHDAREVAIAQRGAGEGEGIRAGTRLVVPIRVAGVRLTDELDTVELDPPRRWVAEHGGLVRGRGSFDLIADDDGTATDIHHHEDLVAPGGPFGWLPLRLGRRLLRRRLAADLGRFKRMVESDLRRSRAGA